MLKLFVYDRGVYGMSVIVASSADEAVSLFKSNELRGWQNVKERDFEVRDLAPGVVIDNLGDA